MQISGFSWRKKKKKERGLTSSDLNPHMAAISWKLSSRHPFTQGMRSLAQFTAGSTTP